MAMPLQLHSLTPLLLLALLAVMSVAHAARPTGTGSDSLGAACNSTTYQETCAKVLGTIPDASTASPRRLAVLAFQYLVKEGATLLTETESAIKAPKKPENVPCLQSADGHLKRYLGLLAKMAPDQSDAKFAEARDKLNEFVMYPYDINYPRNIDEPVIDKIVDYESMLQVTADLLNNAAPAPPKADDEDA